MLNVASNQNPFPISVCRFPLKKTNRSTSVNLRSNRPSYAHPAWLSCDPDVWRSALLTSPHKSLEDAGDFVPVWVGFNLVINKKVRIYVYICMYMYIYRGMPKTVKYKF